MVFQKAIKYKILEFCIDKFFDNIYKNFSNIPINEAGAPCSVQVYKVADDPNSFGPQLVVKIVFNDFEFENSISIEDCTDMVVQIGTEDAISEIILSLCGPLPYSMDEATYDYIYNKIDSRLREMFA